MSREIHMSAKGREVAEAPEGYEFATPAALTLAEYHLILHDLEVAEKNIALLTRRYREAGTNEDDITIAEALFRDAIVQFVGCFGDPRRNKLSPEDTFPTAEALSEFRYVEDLRDAYAAHNFGPQRQCAIVVQEMEGGRLGWARYTVVFSTPEPAMFPRYAALVEAAMCAASKRIDELEAIVRQELVALGREGIEALPRLTVRTPDAHEFYLSRKEFRRGAGGRGPVRSGRRGQKS